MQCVEMCGNAGFEFRQDTLRDGLSDMQLGPLGESQAGLRALCSTVFLLAVSHALVLLRPRNVH